MKIRLTDFYELEKLPECVSLIRKEIKINNKTQLPYEKISKTYYGSVRQALKSFLDISIDEEIKNIQEIRKEVDNILSCINDARGQIEKWFK